MPHGIVTAQIEGLVRDWFSAASRGDARLVDALVSENEGVRLVGSDPDEVFAGGAQVAGFLRGEVVNAGGNVRFDPSQIEAFSEGTVGWATTMLRITLPDGGPCRRAGARCCIGRGISGSSSRFSPRSASRTIRSAGSIRPSAGRSYPRLTLTALSGSSLSKQRW